MPTKKNSRFTLAIGIVALIALLSFVLARSRYYEQQSTILQNTIVQHDVKNVAPEWVSDFAVIEACLAKNDKQCACLLAKKWMETKVEIAPLWALYGQCLLEQEGRATEALMWLQKAHAQHAEDSIIIYWIQRARRMQKEEMKLGMLRSVHFDLQAEDLVYTQGPQLLNALEAAYDSLCLRWDFYPDERIMAVLYASSVYNGGHHLPDWTGALFDGKVRIPANIMVKWPDLRHVVFHEVAHAFHRQLAGKNRLPTWLEEGLAQEFDGTIIDSAWIKEHSLLDSADLDSDFLQAHDASYAKTLYQHSLLRTQQLMQNIGRDSLKTLLKMPW